MSEKKRLFVAIFPSPEVLKTLSRVLDKLAKEFPPSIIRWTPLQQIHLTLNFLGGIEVNRIVDFEAALEVVSGAHPSLELRAAGVGCFPSLRRRRIVWAGMEGQIEMLARLKDSLDGALEKLGYLPEERAFHPHLTIGRVSELRPRQREEFARALGPFEAAQFGQWRAGEIDLVESVLSPRGAVYSVLKSFPLTMA